MKVLCHRIVSLLFLLFITVSGTALAGERNIAITSLHNWRGERALAHRVQEVCETMGWKVDIWERDEIEGMYAVDYDFVIHFVPKVEPHPSAKNYLAIFHPLHHFFDDEGRLLEPYQNFDGYLLTYTPNCDDPNFSGDSPPPTMQWYPTVQNIDYVRVQPNHLLYICSGWGNRYKSERYKKFLERLSKKPYTLFYGDPKFGKVYAKSYKGLIPYGGDALYKTIQNAGVYLLLHSEDHIEYGLPSGRIFEAAASSAVIISDENPFVKQHFGNSVLYIDVTKSGKEMYRQVSGHMKWIKSNQSAAEQKAKRAHEIFHNNFLLEDQILLLGEFHDRVSEH